MLYAIQPYSVKFTHKKISQNKSERLYPIYNSIWLNFAVEYSMQINFELECKTSEFCLLNRFKIECFKIKVHPPFDSVAL